MKFYFVRHGQTEANSLRLLQGCGIDQDLNDLGREQAESLFQMMYQVSFDVVYVSSLKRARQTADIICKGLAHPHQVMHELREWSLGEWEGQPSHLYLDAFLGSGEPPGGESRAEFYARVKTALNSALSGEHPFLIVAHGGVWMVIQDLLGLPRFKITNCQLVELTQINGVWQQRLIEE